MHRLIGPLQRLALLNYGPRLPCSYRYYTNDLKDRLEPLPGADDIGVAVTCVQIHLEKTTNSFFHDLPWETVQKHLTVKQQYLLAFEKSDLIIAHEGWYRYFASGSGQMFNEFDGGLKYVGAWDTRSVLIKAVKTIEHPQHWDKFYNLIQRGSEPLRDTDEAVELMLKDMLAPYEDQYHESRADAFQKYSEMILQDKKEFFLE